PQMSGAYGGPQGPRDAQPGWGPRTSSRPGQPPGQGQPGRPQADAYGRTPSGGPPPRMDSMPPGAQGGHPGAQGAHPGARPRLDNGPGRVDTAPPGPQKPAKRPPMSSPNPSTASAPAKPNQGSKGQGPATFEEMGIPQGKTDGDCVSRAPICC
ncbi:hypothetical protein IMZ48_14700, partial [Candidatus Bathyarchaeota archaeon]|nr:hypothetical protein [Candidatus Bathyarchaeota archaeon]